MRIVLSKEVKGLGNAGEIKEVADGYARNYLLPRGLAVAATASAVKEVEAKRAAESKRQAREEASARTVADRLGATPLVLHAKAGEQHRLYGSITAQDIADAIGQQLGETFDKRKVELEDPIRALGTYTVPVRIARNVVASVNVDVQPEAGG